MKFGDTFMEYLHGNQELFLDKFSHIEYKRLKKVLKRCRTCKSPDDSYNLDNQHQESDELLPKLPKSCECKTCLVCDEMFFNELMKEASDISGLFNSRVRHLLNFHISGFQWYLAMLRKCFKNDQQTKVEEGKLLIEYLTMNAIAIQKILKKYDKVHSSTTGNNFKSKMRSKHIELLQSPWLIELGAFYLNASGCDGVDEVSGQFYCDLDATPPVMTIILLGSLKIEYDLTCAVCLDTVFNPYALSCGHLFCKSCACSAASVMIIQGLKDATLESKCPICRETGVYSDAVHMLELHLLLKKRRNEYWKERLIAERTEMAKQSKEFWESQTKYVIGY